MADAEYSKRGHRFSSRKRKNQKIGTARENGRDWQGKRMGLKRNFIATIPPNRRNEIPYHIKWQIRPPASRHFMKAFMPVDTSEINELEEGADLSVQ